MKNKKIELPIDEIIKKYEDGSTTRELGIEYGVSHGTISNRMIEHYKKLGKQVPNHKTKEVPIKEIVEQYESGIKIQDSAKKYKVLDSTIIRKLEQYYTNIGKARQHRKTGRKKIEISIKDIISKYENGLSQTQIAEEYQVSQVYIWGRINEYYTQTGEEKPIKKSGRKRKELPISEIAKEYESGVSQIELAEKYEISNLIISTRLKEYYKDLGRITPKILKSPDLVINFLNRGLTIEQIIEVADSKDIIIPQHIMNIALSEMNKKNINDDTEER